MIVTLGDVVEDVVVRLQGPLAHGTDTPSTVLRRRGGSAANTAVAAARLGRRARFVGCLGDDATGEWLSAELGGSGVEWRGIVGGRTATVVVLVHPDGERSMLTDRGSADDLAPFDPAWLDSATALHVPVYSLSGQPMATTAATAIGHARSLGIPVTIDVSSVDVIRRIGASSLLRLLDDLGPSAVLANEDESAALGGIEGWGRRRCPLVIKRGPEPALASIAGIVHEVEVEEARRDGVDTTGAGDAFAAGFVVALVDTPALVLDAAVVVDAVRAGHAAAAGMLGRR